MINQARLQELADDFGAEDLAELIESFLEEAAEAVEELGTMISDEYTATRSAQFHFIKGCAVNVGATELGEVCEKLEHRHAGFTQAEYAALKNQFHEIQAYFSEGGLKLIA